MTLQCQTMTAQGEQGLHSYAITLNCTVILEEQCRTDQVNECYVEPQVKSVM